MEVRFYETADDDKLKFAVIVSQTHGKWVFCKHRERDTYEVPGGHREPGEDILDTAKRELREETGAIDYEIEPVCIYSIVDEESNIQGQETETFGLLCYAEIKTFEPELHSEIEKIIITDIMPESWTYPLTQPKLIPRVSKFIKEKNGNDKYKIHR